MTKAIPNFGCKSLLFVVKYTCQLRKSHRLPPNTEVYRSGTTMQGSVSKWRDASSKQSSELFVAKVGSACPRPDITRQTRNQHFQTEYHLRGELSKWRDALSKQSCELFVAKAGNACPRPARRVKQTVQ